MPMLERRAVSLETCHVQRVLPPPKPPFKSSRRLHTAFWQHGAADIELSNVWQTLVREPLASPSLLPTPSASRAEPSSASTFLLDFLYPQSATSLLRGLSPSVLDRHEQSRLYLRGAPPRLFSSSASASQESQDTTQETDTEALAQDEHVKDEVDHAEYDGVSDKAIPQRHLRESQNTRTSKGRGQNTQGSRGHAEESGQSPSKILHELLKKDKSRDFDTIWELYHVQVRKSADRKAVRQSFLDYATKHRSMSQLLAKAIKDRNWSTVYETWKRYPDAHGEEVRALDWKQIEEIITFNELAPRLTSLAKRLRRLEKQEDSTIGPQLAKSLLSRVVDPMAKRYMINYRPSDFIPLLLTLQDPLFHETYIGFLTSENMKSEADIVYRDYRKIPGVKIRGHIMHKMLRKVYLYDNAVGVEMVVEDAYARFGKLGMYVYRVYMDFFARRGDVASVQRLWEEYTSHYAEERKPKPYHRKEVSDNPDFLPLLHVHAVRGEINEVRRIFSEAQKTYGVRLNTICWNVLLNAHAKAGEYDAAVRVFGAMQQAVQPDKYTYGTIMGMSGSMGDLEFTLELYRMAKNGGVEPNAAMVDCVVEAYCQNDRLSEAENICAMTTKHRRFKNHELTVLWNTLIHHHAIARDLGAVSRLLNTMTESGIPYNDETYSQLLRALAYCRQPHHALFLIQEAVKKRSFKPSLQHYALLMTAFIRTGQPQETLRTSRILRSLGAPQSGHVLLRVLQALGTWSSGNETGKPSNHLVSAVRQFRRFIEKSQQPQIMKLRIEAPNKEAYLQPHVDPYSVATRTSAASILIYVLSQMREMTSIEEIVKLWRSSSPETSSMEDPPLKLLDALMAAALYEGAFDECKGIWNDLFDRTVAMSRVSAPGIKAKGPLPSMAYKLNSPLKIMQRMYGAKKDPDGLRDVVSSVLAAGFRLDSKNWNLYVQLMADMKKYREAFMACEEQLMPYWTGWERVRQSLKNKTRYLPMEKRRRGLRPHNPRPIAETFTVLSKAYIDLDAMSGWSAEAERLFNYINNKCIMAVAAIKSQRGSDNYRDKDIMEGKKRPSDSLEEPLMGESDVMPEAFEEMMAKIHTEDSASPKESDWEPDDKGPEGSKGESGQEDEWYDVNEEDENNWTPMTPDQREPVEVEPFQEETDPQALQASQDQVARLYLEDRTSLQEAAWWTNETSEELDDDAGAMSGSQEDQANEVYDVTEQDQDNQTKSTSHQRAAEPVQPVARVENPTTPDEGLQGAEDSVLGKTDAPTAEKSSAGEEELDDSPETRLRQGRRKSPTSTSPADEEAK